MYLAVNLNPRNAYIRPFLRCLSLEGTHVYTRILQANDLPFPRENIAAAAQKDGS